MSWILKLYDDYRIPYVTEGEHTSPGWAHTDCPFCVGNPGTHLGFCFEYNYFHCWRCGHHPIVKTVAALTGMSQGRAGEVIGQYDQGSGRRRSSRAQKDTDKKVTTRRYRHPSGTTELDDLHWSYLEKRRFDPEKIEAEWGLLGTGPASYLDHIDYRFRLLAPIYWDGKEVSFQTRDCTNKAQAKYRGCPKHRELMHYKEILYGRQERWGDIGICVEGITDVWRLGPKAFATFGITTSKETVLRAIRSFKKIVVLFDNERAAQKRARTIADKISLTRTRVQIEKLEGTDPGDLPQDDADHLVRTLTRRVT